MRSPVRRLLLRSSRDGGELVQGFGGNGGDNGGKMKKSRRIWDRFQKRVNKMYW